MTSRASALLRSPATWPLFALLLVLAVNFLVAPEFFHLEIRDGRVYGTLVDVIKRGAPVALLAIGMSLVIATGGIDLSVGAVMAIAGSICSLLISGGAENTALIVSAGLAVGAVAGLVNGGLVGWLGLQPIVATLVLMVAGRGIAQLISGGRILTFQHEGFAALGSGTWLGFPVPVFLVALVWAITHLLTRRTALGLFIEAVGCNPTASRYLGIPVPTVKMMAYVAAGLCSALAGIIATADIQGADANNIGLWLELDAILAVVLGGASLTGGRFSIGLSLVGVLIIQSLTTGIIMSGLPARYNLIIKAVVILVVLLLQTSRFRGQVAALLPGARRVAPSAGVPS
jgi:galactofuranose transport system permease protein